MVPSMPSLLTRHLLLPAFALFGSCGLSFAADQKVAVVDMEQVFSECSASREAAARKEAEEASSNRELEKRRETLKALVAEIERLKALPSPSGGTNDGSRLQAKVAEARMMDREIADFRAAREKQLRESMLRLRGEVLEGISKAVSSVAERKGIDLVLDKSAAAPGSLPLVVHARGDLDLTREILGMMNSQPHDAKERH